MNPEDINKLLCALIVEQLAVDCEQVTPTANLAHDLGADSLDMVELVMAVEADFNVSIDDSDAAKFVTVGDIEAWLNEAR